MRGCLPRGTFRARDPARRAVRTNRTPEQLGGNPTLAYPLRNMAEWRARGIRAGGEAGEFAPPAPYSCVHYTPNGDVVLDAGAWVYYTCVEDGGKRAALLESTSPKCLILRSPSAAQYSYGAPLGRHLRFGIE